jgi:hypothetical protein
MSNLHNAAEIFVAKCHKNAAKMPQKCYKNACYFGVASFEQCNTNLNQS